MHYAQTLATTHEREFLRYRKIIADARELAADLRDLYDMLELDKRTDRILPNGLCLLPPRQACAKGNLPDLRQVRHRCHLPARTHRPATTHRPTSTNGRTRLPPAPDSR
ncbi:hypothetical protein ACFV0D_03225 [Streptomyces sp. NPDC059556]|uniref:hypothetical protein n=1 Tax=Streptomyces sp. NPDC059556 TaxID=3346863 RepID=UPI00369B45F1